MSSRQISEKQLNTIIAYLLTIDPITGQGNMHQACQSDDTLTLSNAYKMTKRDNWDELVKLTQIEVYKKSLKITDLSKDDLIHKVEIACAGFEEYLNPITGSLKLVEITPQLKQKARVELAALRKWGDKTVNHKHDITDFLNKVASKGFTLPKPQQIDNAIDVEKL